MANTGPRFAVPAPPRFRPQVSLLDASATNQGADPPAWMRGIDGERIADDRWTHGIAFQPEQCGAVGPFDPCDPEIAAINTTPPIVRYDPFPLLSSETCWPRVGMDGIRDASAMARRVLDRMTPKGVETEFWGGEFAALTPGVNNYLTNPGSVQDITPDSGTAPLAYALGFLQAALAACGEGGRGIIHAPRRTVSLWHSAYLLIRDPGSAIITDLFGNIVVPGVGYDGGSPRAAATTLVDWSAAPGSGTITYTFPGVFGTDGLQVDPVTVAFDAAVATLETALEASLGAGTVASISGTTVNLDHTITWAGRLEGYALQPTVTCSVACTATVSGTAGSSTTDETGDTQWAYATSPTQVWLSDIHVFPDVENASNEMGNLLFEENEIEFSAQRFAAPLWDNCCHFGINVDLCSTCCTPTAEA